ncbi:MAG TPA: pyridoxamine 5'-phosphate oxidase family protein, partial [Longimicrobiales bacterium]|nr:pyridoxamine 5'-phosphate oxidase family protein [Longimicrobiales bacterium]
MTPRHVEPRRRDRGKDEAWIRAYLAAAPWGVLAIPGDDGVPRLNGNLFVYLPDPHRIYLHSARAGALPAALHPPEESPASFTAAEMGRLLPAPEALEFSVEYSGVVVTGKARTVQDPEEARVALQALLDKYAPHLIPGR